MQAHRNGNPMNAPVFWLNAMDASEALHSERALADMRQLGQGDWRVFMFPFCERIERSQGRRAAEDFLLSATQVLAFLCEATISAVASYEKQGLATKEEYRLDLIVYIVERLFNARMVRRGP